MDRKHTRLRGNSPRDVFWPVNACSVSLEWIHALCRVDEVFHSRAHDPDNCAGWQVCEDEAAAHEEAQWRVDGHVARRTVSYGGWWTWTGGMIQGNPAYERIMTDVIG